MSVEVVEVKSRRDREAVIRLPYGIYRGEGQRYEAWVPPLDLDVRLAMNKKKNPLYHHADGKFWIAKENGRILGRVAGFIDRNFIEFHKTQTGFFGFFECYDKLEVARALFDCVEKWLRANGMERVIGPVNGSTNHQIGNQIDSFDEIPVIEMPYSAPFYGNLIENVGYRKDKDIYSFRNNFKKHPVSDKIQRVSAMAAERNGVTIRLANTKKKWAQEVAIVKKIWEEAWRNNWGFTPWYDLEFTELANNLKLVMNPQITYIAEIAEKPVGFCFPIMDINFAFQKINGKLFPTGIFHLLAAKKKANSIRLAAFGVLKEHQNKGIDGIMLTKLYHDCMACNIDIGEFSWILETNYALINLVKKLGCKHYRTHRIYEKNL